jgi:hypothetical protein
MQCTHGIWGNAARFALAVASVSGLAVSTTARAADWSDMEFQFLYGTNFHQPFIPGDVTKSIVTLQNASGWKYGRTFFFVDFLKSNQAGNNAGEVYGGFTRPSA